MEKDLQILIEAAHAGGEVLNKYFGQAFDITEKSSAFDFQTEADLKSEQAILSIINAKLPHYNTHSEEEGKTQNNSEYTVVIDPLDGTNNFVIGIPNFSVSIAIMHKDEAIAGVVYNPIINQTFTALKGRGAYLNGKLIKVNNVVDLKKMTLAYSCGYKTDRTYIVRVFNALLSAERKRITNSWSPAYEYCLIASGKTESIITDSTELHDFAAGKLIALEAGAKIIDFFGKKDINYLNNNFILSNTDEINEHALNIIKSLQKDS